MSNDSVAQFWQQYIAALHDRGIPEKRHIWYVRHVERFVRAQQARLRQRSPTDVEAHIVQLGREPRVEGWQLLHHIEALHILFVRIVKSQWATKYNWEALKEKTRTLEFDHGTVARDNIAVTPQPVPVAAQGVKRHPLIGRHFWMPYEALFVAMGTRFVPSNPMWSGQTAS